MKILLLCEKAKPYLVQGVAKPMHTLDTTNPFSFNWKLVNKGFSNDRLNGKIVAECDFEVEEIDTTALSEHTCDDYYDDNIDRISKGSCLTCEQMREYLGTTWDSKGYAIHIKNLHIFDESKVLSDFTIREPRLWDSIVCDSCTNFGCDCTKCSNYYDYREVVKAPCNMMKVCEWDVKDKILVPLKPNELCNILNGVQTILVKRKVLREML